MEMAKMNIYNSLPIPATGKGVLSNTHGRGPMAGYLICETKSKKTLALIFASPPIVMIFLEYLRITPTMAFATLRDVKNIQIPKHCIVDAMHHLRETLGSSEMHEFFKANFDEARSTYLSAGKVNPDNKAKWLACFLFHGMNIIDEWNNLDTKARSASYKFNDPRLYEELEQRTAREMPQEWRFLPTEMPKGLKKGTNTALVKTEKFKETELERYNRLWIVIFHMKTDFSFSKFLELYADTKQERLYDRGCETPPWWEGDSVTGIEHGDAEAGEGGLQEAADSTGYPNPAHRPLDKTYVDLTAIDEDGDDEGESAKAEPPQKRARTSKNFFKQYSDPRD